MSNKTAVERLSNEVQNELAELDKLGIVVPSGAVTAAKDHSQMEEYVDTCVSTTELCDLLITLHS